MAAIVVPAQGEAGVAFPAITGSGFTAAETVKLACSSEIGDGGLSVNLYLTADGSGNITTASKADITPLIDGDVNFTATGLTSTLVAHGTTRVFTVD